MGRHAHFLLTAVVIVSLAQAVLADHVVIKNGDRLTGKIVKKDGEKITISTRAAGVVEILWEEVQEISVDDPVYVELEDGRTVKGAVRPVNGGLELFASQGLPITVQSAEIAVIRNESEQKSFEAEKKRMTDPGILQLWRGSANLGFSLTTGNSRTRSLTFGAKAERPTTNDKISLFIKGIQAGNSTRGPSVTTAQAVWFGGRYDRNISDKTFVFGTADLEYDKPQSLNLRTVIGGGFGFRAIRTENAELDIFGGAAFNREYFSGEPNRSSAEVLVGEELKYSLTSATDIEQRFVLYPSVSRAGTFRSTFNATVVTSINEWLGWQVSVGNRSNSDPVPGASSNDLLFSTGLRATFGRKKGN